MALKSRKQTPWADETPWRMTWWADIFVCHPASLLFSWVTSGIPGQLAADRFFVDLSVTANKALKTEFRLRWPVFYFLFVNEIKTNNKKTQKTTTQKNNPGCTIFTIYEVHTPIKQYPCQGQEHQIFSFYVRPQFCVWSGTWADDRTMPTMFRPLARDASHPGSPLANATFVCWQYFIPPTHTSGSRQSIICSNRTKRGKKGKKKARGCWWMLNYSAVWLMCKHSEVIWFPTTISAAHSPTVRSSVHHHHHYYYYLYDKSFFLWHYPYSRS